MKFERGVLWSVMLVSGVGLGGCVADPTEGDLTSTIGATSGPVFLDQGWDEGTRAAFYQTTQGSRMLPYQWFLSLEQASNNQPFKSPVNMRRMGFLVDGETATNPDNLPVGFAKDEDPSRGASIGLTCAACHTGQLVANGVTLRIDGGQSFADLEQLQQGLLDSLNATLTQPLKLKRFGNKVLGDTATAADHETLRANMVIVRDWWAARIARSRGASPHGPSRIDAFTIIGNEVVCHLLQNPANCAPANAPTQFPHLWKTPDFEWVQYNSSVHSPIGRNVGEVTGVFAEASLSPTGVVSSANLRNLDRLENWLTTLESPAWPEDVLGAIDHGLAAQGQAIYATACASCHPVVAPRTGPNAFGLTFAKVDFSTPIAPNAASPFFLATDPLAAMTFATRRADPGPWRPIAEAQGLVGPDNQVAVAALLAISGSMIIQRWFAVNGFTNLQKIQMLGFRESRSPTIPQLTTYKARPLDGIAFTAPYLHNGSVPSMYELLLPPAQRTKQFWVGSQQFDAVKLGFSTVQEPQSVLLDTTKLGNSNGGHYFGTDLQDPDRMALIEYMKTL